MRGSVGPLGPECDIDRCIAVCVGPIGRPKAKFGESALAVLSFDSGGIVDVDDLASETRSHYRISETVLKNTIGGPRIAEAKWARSKYRAMSESNAYETYGKPIIKGAVVFLISLSLFASYSLLAQQGISADTVGDVLVTLYISVLVFYGVFWEAMDTHHFRLALYFGVLLWGAERFVSGGESFLTVALILGGLGMFVRELYFTD